MSVTCSFCATSDIITCDQNCHHLYSSPAGGKDLSTDTQIRMMGSMEPKICTKMLRNLSEKLVTKFPTTTPSDFVVKIARLEQ